MEKKSRWVRFRDAIKRFFVDLFKEIVNFLKKDATLKEIFRQAGIEIITLIKNLEGDTSMTGAQKRAYAVKEIKNILKQKGLQVRTYLINLVIEMALAYIRGRK